VRGRGRESMHRDISVVKHPMFAPMESSMHCICLHPLVFQRNNTCVRTHTHTHTHRQTNTIQLFLPHLITLLTPPLPLSPPPLLQHLALLLCLVHRWLGGWRSSQRPMTTNQCISNLIKHVQEENKKLQSSKSIMFRNAGNFALESSRGSLNCWRQCIFASLIYLNMYIIFLCG